MKELDLTEKSRIILSDILEEDNLECTTNMLTDTINMLQKRAYDELDISTSHALFQTAYELQMLLSKLLKIRKEQYGTRE
ncbi:MAG: hypothetical protein K5683_02790 [Prevotella sp.]|nr:hypothetical protein [Prevotella sp.]